MSKHAICILIILCFIPIGCATTPKKSYMEIISAWNGRHIDRLIDRAGYPQSSFIAPNGNKVYVYSTTSTHTSPIMTTPVGNYLMTFGGHQKTDYCNTFFETDNNGIIVKCSYKGNLCK